MSARSFDASDGNKGVELVVTTPIGESQSQVERIAVVGDKVYVNDQTITYRFDPITLSGGSTIFQDNSQITGRTGEATDPELARRVQKAYERYRNDSNVTVRDANRAESIISGIISKVPTTSREL
ncbi:MAG: hypothetical protein ACOYJ2_09250 [Rickettsiales bacterium]